MGLVEDDRVYLLRDRRYGSGLGFVRLLRDSLRKGVGLEKFIARLRDGSRWISYGELERNVPGRPRLVIPITPPEVWGAGVTYQRSREARELETKAKGIYDLVYDAERPEIFFKATPSRCVGPYETAYIRSDTSWAVPEPELALVLGPDHEIAGFTVGNDLSARDIEGENPLYLPQAKIYRGSCALGPAITPRESIANPMNIEIKMRIFRRGVEVFTGSVNTSKMKRRLEELVEYLVRDNVIPAGTVLLTGTGIVPPDDFTLRDGDVVEIEAEGIGVLRNPISQYPR
ncbi:Ureidoglycolate lyase [archaeon HR01]|nr:Ureidoglycolate lyase [archaeon HR01]